MKNFSDIQTLLDRYWEGETTLDEERALKAYFNSSQIDERLRAVAPLFQVLRTEQTIQYTHKTKVVALKPAVYSWQKIAVAASAAILLSAGAWWWANSEKQVSEQIAQQPPVQQEQPVAQDKPTESTAVADNKPVNTSKQQGIPKDSIKKRKKPQTIQPDPETELAMEEIKAALALVSSKIRRGKQEAAKGATHLETVDKVFKKKTEG